MSKHQAPHCTPGRGLPEDMACEDRVGLQVEETLGVPGGPQEPVLGMAGGSTACAQQGLSKQCLE